jgi:hypothetical protein
MAGRGRRLQAGGGIAVHDPAHTRNCSVGSPAGSPACANARAPPLRWRVEPAEAMGIRLQPAMYGIEERSE